MTRSRSEILGVTTDGVPGRQVAQALGMVRGSTVRARHPDSDIVAALRNLIGGEVREHAALPAGAREQAIDRMFDATMRRGADAVAAVRMETSVVQNAVSEVVCHDAAVRLA